MTRTLKITLYIGLVIGYGLIFPLSFLPLFAIEFCLIVWWVHRTDRKKVTR